MIYMPELGESCRERHQAFIEANIDQLATAAREGYREHGRGMLLMDDADFVDKPRGLLTKYRRVYVAVGTPEFDALGGSWPGGKEACWVSEYDPATTMLVGFARTDGGVSSYRVRFAFGVADGTEGEHEFARNRN
ncbi:MAG: hypothetical protein ACI96M_000393 [Candidatus Azotimanducaceae bacterium]|jgi:hypothetical protein